MEARLTVLDMIYKAQKSHIGSNFSVAEIMAALLNVTDQKHDRVIMSKGWAAAIMYWWLHEKGEIGEEYKELFCEKNTEYIGLLEPHIKGVHMASGSVGMGLSFGFGMAKAKQLKKEPGRVFVIEGDAGCQTGHFWEAAQLAEPHKLENLTLIVDMNGLQAMGSTEGIAPHRWLTRRLSDIGWEAVEINGHDCAHILTALDMQPKKRPSAIICRTVKCKGIPSMENKTESHYRPPTKEEYEEAKAWITANHS